MMYSKNNSTELASQCRDSNEFDGITWVDKSLYFGVYRIASFSTQEEAYLEIHPELDPEQEEFEPTEEEIRVFENIKNGKEKMTRQNAEELIKELKDMSDEQS